MVKDFPKQKQRSAVCFSQFRRKNNVTINRFITKQAAPGEIRQDTFNGSDYTVVPIVALREGVFQCETCEGPELYLAQEFAGLADSWNGRPVTLGHPKRNGVLVSAGSKDIQESAVIGIVFNAELDDDKLKLEAWIDNEKVKDLGDDAQATLDRMVAGEQVEVSTGYWANVRPSSGKFNGKAYVGVQTNVVPDHLAILEEGTIGACSWKDGCGAPRLNANDAHCDECTDFRDNLRELMMKILAEHELSDTDRRRALEAVLNEKEEFRFAWIVAVFSDEFVFEHNGALWRQGFVISEDDGITLGDDMVQVRPETHFVDVKTNQETAMEKEQTVNELIANKATKFTDDNKTWLMSLEEEQLDMLAPVEAAPAEGEGEGTPAPAAPANTPEVDPDKLGSPNSEEDEPVTLQSYIGDAPEEIQEVLNEGIKLQNTQKAKLVKAITANKHCSFTEDELKDKKLDELTKLAALSGVDSYEGSAPRGSLLDNEDADAAPEAPLVFNIGKDAEAA